MRKGLASVTEALGRVAPVSKWLERRRQMQSSALARLPTPESFPELPPLPPLQCPVFRPSDPDYPAARYQYATTSYAPSAMSPGAIVRPRPGSADADVRALLAYARTHDVPLAIRTGGHSYNGTSSCGPHAIQLDLREAYRDWEYDPVAGTVRMGVSFSLEEMYERLRSHETSPGHALFLADRQCSAVHVGGHCQTGGYGQIARGFGLFADFIVRAELLTADGERHVIAPDAEDPLDRDLFWAVFGSGPGNFGVLTHVTVKPGRDEDHPDSRAWRCVVPYTKGEDAALLVELARIVEDFENAPRGYDICITWSSAEQDFFANAFGIAGQADDQGPPKKNFSSAPYPCVIVYFQYSNAEGPGEVYDPSWAQRIRDVIERRAPNKLGGTLFTAFVQSVQGVRRKLPDDRVHTPISRSMSHLWMFNSTREFNYPVKKYTAFTDVPASPEFAQWCVDCTDPLIDREDEGIMVIVQYLHMGGPASMHRRHGESSATSFSWRDTGFVVVIDIFYNPDMPDAEREVARWHAKVRATGMGEGGKVGVYDRRWIWSPYGEKDMSVVWKHYFDSEAKYLRAMAIARRVDPTGIFAPSPFHLLHAERAQRREVA
ncbi:MAG: FAD-binding oxidoreductase [Polyangiales bacterium]